MLAKPVGSAPDLLEEAVALTTILASERMANVAGASHVIDGGLTKTT